MITALAFSCDIHDLSKNNDHAQHTFTDSVFMQHMLLLYHSHHPVWYVYKTNHYWYAVHVLMQRVSSLVGALSPVNHKGLHQGWTQTSLYLQVIHFTSHHTTSHVGFFFSLLIFRGHSVREPASSRVIYFILRAYTGTSVNHSQRRKNRERFWKKCRWMDWKGRNKEEIPGSNRSVNGNILTHSRL